MMRVYPELDRLPLQDLIQRFQSPAPCGEEPWRYYGEVAMSMRQQGEAGLDFLFAQLESDQNTRLRAVLLALAQPVLEDTARQATLRAHLHTFLRDERPLIVMDAIESLGYMGDQEAQDSVLALRDHDSPYVRSGVLRYVSRLSPASAPATLRDGLHDPHYSVRETAIDELARLGVRAAIDQIRPLTSDTNLYVQQAARTAIAHLEQTELAADTAG